VLETVISNLIHQQRPYYLLQGNSLKGVDNQYWLVFKHRDADNLLHNIVGFLGIFEKHSTYKVLRIDLKTAHVFEYIPKREGDIPNTTLLRTSRLTVIEQFLQLENAVKEEALLAGSFLELENQIPRPRKFSLPGQLSQYHEFITAYLERTKLYRRSTAYFNSGVLKLYEEPLRQVIRNQGEIRLLMDWQGFTNKYDVKELNKLHDPDYRAHYIRLTLAEFLRGLEDSSFTSTQILAELVRLEILSIKLVKMDTKRRAIYHKKTGVLTDQLGNHISHEGSDNFTRAARSDNAESVIFLYHDNPTDLEAIEDSIKEFDEEWRNGELTFDLNQEFLQQTLVERDHRLKAKQPAIQSITPNELTAGEVTEVKLAGGNLKQVQAITAPDNELIQVVIKSNSKTRIAAQFEISPEHPPQQLEELLLTIPEGEYRIQLSQPVSIIQPLQVPEFGEIAGFKQAVESILAGHYGKPQDFLYWMAQQRPHLLRVRQSDFLDEFVDQRILFEHQKSGAQHCLRVMRDFGVAVCADAVGLGKTRLAASVAKLYRQENGSAKIAIIAAKKLHPNWEREMAELGFNRSDYEPYNKNLMSRKGSNFLADFNRYGGPDLVIIDEAHEGIRNHNNRIHKTCLEIRERDHAEGRQRHFLLLTATPWNNRREDIYNLLSPFLSRPEGFNDLGFPTEVAQWFESREVGVENFTDDTNLFRHTYRELFLQRTRKMLKEATPDLNLYAQRVAEWLPVVFEADTEQALDQIFTQFETSLYIPSADPIRYLKGSVEQRSLLANQRRFFLQRAESSMYALRRTIKNFGDRIRLVKRRLESVTPDADGLKKFMLLHYEFESDTESESSDLLELDDSWDEDFEQEEEDEEETDTAKEEKRQQLRRSIDIATDDLRDSPVETQHIYNQILANCNSDLAQLDRIQQLLAYEFVRDHKRGQVTQKVRELVSQGRKVLLISNFSDTVIDYYRHMASDQVIATQGIGMAMGSTKRYYPSDSDKSVKVNQNNAIKRTRQHKGIKRQQIFRLFAPVATCKTVAECPHSEEEIAVLIGSETLSVGQNLQDADYLINIDLPWNPMVLEQRIGRIDRPKQHFCENIYIYYANSESQLLRQASRLSNLHNKLVGDLSGREESNGGDEPSPNVPTITSIDSLGASIYGDTLFDDEILPGYVAFIRSLVEARQIEQGSLQEDTYQKQETSRELYTQNEILHSEELSKLIENLGEDYQANPIAVGHHTSEPDNPTCLVALTLEYFGPNGEAIPEQKQTIYWNNQTKEQDGYGVAITTAFKTPEAGGVVSASPILSVTQNLYEQLTELKQQRLAELEQPETLENINVTSERISRIQQRVKAINSFPADITSKTVGQTLKELNQGKELKKVQKLLREYTEANKSKLSDDEFVKQLVNDVKLLSLLSHKEIKPTSLKVSLSALLLRATLE